MIQIDLTMISLLDLIAAGCETIKQLVGYTTINNWLHIPQAYSNSNSLKGWKFKIEINSWDNANDDDRKEMKKSNLKYDSNFNFEVIENKKHFKQKSKHVLI